MHNSRATLQEQKLLNFNERFENTPSESLSKTEYANRLPQLLMQQILTYPLIFMGQLNVNQALSIAGLTQLCNEIRPKKSVILNDTMQKKAQSLAIGDMRNRMMLQIAVVNRMTMNFPAKASTSAEASSSFERRTPVRVKAEESAGEALEAYTASVFTPDENSWDSIDRRQIEGNPNVVYAYIHQSSKIEVYLSTWDSMDEIGLLQLVACKDWEQKNVKFRDYMEGLSHVTYMGDGNILMESVYESDPCFTKSITDETMEEL